MEDLRHSEAIGGSTVTMLCLFTTYARKQPRSPPSVSPNSCHWSLNRSKAQPQPL